MAEREGFEPSRPFWSLHAFQACAFDRSATSPQMKKRDGRALPLWSNQNNGGDERDRTADLLVANETLSQLSYIPTSIKTLWRFSQPLDKLGAFKDALRGASRHRRAELHPHPCHLALRRNSLKKSLKALEHSSFNIPPATFTWWFNLGFSRACAMLSTTPAFGSEAP